MVVLVNLEMLEELLDALGQYGYLYFNGTSVRFVAVVLLDDGSASLSVQAVANSAGLQAHPQCFDPLSLCSLFEAKYSIREIRVTGGTTGLMHL